MSERVSVFSCGSQYHDWQSRNCERCMLYNPETYYKRCELELAMFDSYLGNGSLAPEIAERLGYVEGVGFWQSHPVSGGPEFAYTWDCPERELKPDA